jgi:hypothetical protein
MAIDKTDGKSAEIITAGKKEDYGPYHAGALQNS